MSKTFKDIPCVNRGRKEQGLGVAEESRLKSNEILEIGLDELINELSVFAEKGGTIKSSMSLKCITLDLLVNLWYNYI